VQLERQEQQQVLQQLERQEQQLALLLLFYRKPLKRSLTWQRIRVIYSFVVSS
jgi:hypothetical protein